MSLMDWLEEGWHDPKFRGRVFTAIWVIAYGMLILGFALILLVLMLG